MIGLEKKNWENMGGCREHDGGRERVQREGSQRACTGIYKWRKGLSVTWPGDANKATGCCVPGEPCIRMQITCKVWSQLDLCRNDWRQALFSL